MLAQPKLNPKTLHKGSPNLKILSRLIITINIYETIISSVQIE